MKICSKCNTEKPLTEFYNNTQKYSACKQCKNEQGKAWAKANQHRVKEHRRKTRLKTIYGMSLEKYKAMFDEQGGKCALCGNTEENKHLAVDHCHTTGNIRALLCTNCNTVLGKVHDDVNLLSKMTSYLMQHQSKEN